MTPKDVIKNTIDMGHMVLKTYLSDLSDADLMVRAVPTTNHITWQRGHLIAAEQKMMTDAGFKMPELPSGFADSHGKEASTSDDPKNFRKKSQYLDLLMQQRTATIAALDAVSESRLDQATPDSMKDYAPTVAAAFNMIGVHTMMHAAQFVAVRRKLVKPVLI